MAAAPWMRDWLAGIIGASVLCSALLVISWFHMPEEARSWINQRIGR
jgi:hypothetical protein